VFHVFWLRKSEVTEICFFFYYELSVGLINPKYNTYYILVSFESVFHHPPKLEESQKIFQRQKTIPYLGLEPRTSGLAVVN
jgi:hypothetical protein